MYLPLFTVCHLRARNKPSHSAEVDWSVGLSALYTAESVLSPERWSSCCYVCLAIRRLCSSIRTADACLVLITVSGTLISSFSSDAYLHTNFRTIHTIYLITPHVFCSCHVNTPLPGLSFSLRSSSLSAANNNYGLGWRLKHSNSGFSVSPSSL